MSVSRVVAVAGGSGNLGRAIVEAILAHGTFTPIIFARKADAEKEKQIGARIVPVDYNSTDAITKTLEEEKVDTVISVLNTINGPEPEFNLIKAAQNASPTRRFIPSVWGIEFPPWVVELFPAAQGKLDIVSFLKTTSLEWTVWYPGYFLDWWVAPHIKTYMATFALVADIANNAAAIPVRGDVPVVVTYTFDVAKFVAASLLLSKWDKETYCIGDKVTMNQLIALAEDAKGVKFDITTDSLDLLKSKKVTELPSHLQTYAFFPKEMLQAFLATFGLMFSSGTFDLKPAHTINDDFPEIKPRTVKELITEAWQAK